MILVTGGSGLIGQELISQLLRSGKTVKAIHHVTPLPFADHPGLIPISCDILDIDRLEEIMGGISEVYHCAAKVSFQPDELRQLFKVNVEGTANVVNAALSTGVRKLLHVSSVSALGPNSGNGMINEMMQWTPETSTSRYGQSKYLSELEVWRGAAEGLKVVIVNPTIVLGAGNWEEGSTKIFHSIYKEFPWYTEGEAGFVSAKDVARAMILLMGSDVSGERFILNAENARFKKIFDKIALAFNKPAPSKKAGPILSGIIWRMEYLKSKLFGSRPLITKETATAAHARIFYDNDKLIKFLPDFTYEDMSQSISEICVALQQKLNTH